LPELEDTKIRADGQVQEWSKDFVEGEPSHRHLSHLFGVYPGAQYHTGNAKDMMEASEKTLLQRSSSERGAGKVGWSISWMVALYARLADPEKAFEVLLRYHSEKVIYPNLMGKGGNALEQCAGLTADMAEMLLQSHDGEIKLLPALPKQWAVEGEVKGLVARGGIEVSMKWKNGRLISAELLSKKDKHAQVRIEGKTVKVSLKAGQKTKLDL
jgi:alpha-L-fucosidase 2